MPALVFVEIDRFCWSRRTVEQCSSNVLRKNVNDVPINTWTQTAQGNVIFPVTFNTSVKSQILVRGARMYTTKRCSASQQFFIENCGSKDVTKLCQSSTSS